MKDGSMDRCIEGLYQGMAIHFLYSGQEERAYIVSHALLASKFCETPSGVPYIVIDSACLKLPPEFRQKLPKEYTLEYAMRRWESAYLIYWFTPLEIPVIH